MPSLPLASRKLTQTQATQIFWRRYLRIARGQGTTDSCDNAERPFGLEHRYRWPSDNADAAYKVLKYAIEKGYGYGKLLLIDPSDIMRLGSLPCINPIHRNDAVPVVVGSFMDSCSILWGQGSFANTPRIQKDVPGIPKDEAEKIRSARAELG